MRLHPTVPFMSGETPASFVSRLARVNGIVSVQAMCGDLGLDFRRIFFGNRDAIVQLAELVGIDADPLLAETRMREGNVYRLRGELMTRATFSQGSVRVCPRCIVQDRAGSGAEFSADAAPYHRTTWTIGHLRTCPHHDVVIVDMPVPPTEAARDFSRVVAALFRTGVLDQLTVRRRETSSFEHYLLDRLEGRRGASWLDGFPFYAAARVCETIGVVSLFGRTPKLKLLSSHDWATAGQAGYQIAATPDDVHEFLASLISNCRTTRTAAIGPSAWFGYLYTWLEHQQKDAAYDPMRNLIIENVANNAAFHVTEKLFGRPPPYRKLHSIRTAACEIDLSEVRVRKALAHAGHLPLHHETLPPHEVVFDACIAADLLRRISTSVTLNDLATRWGIAWQHARQLVRDGYLPAISKEASGTAFPYVALEDIEAFESILRSGSIEIEIVPDDACDLGAACHRAHCSLINIIDLIYNKKLEWVGFIHKDGYLRSIFVKIDEVQSLISRACLKGKTRRDIEKSLGIPSSTVNILIKKRFFSTFLEAHPTLPINIAVVPSGDVEQFRAEYMRVSDVAEFLGLARPTARRVLASNGIEPKLSKAEYDATFYARSDVEAFKAAGLHRSA